MIHHVQSGHQSNAVALAINRPTRAFDAPRTPIAIDPHDQYVSQFFGLAQELNMSGMQDIEDAIGKNYRATRAALNVKRSNELV